MLRIPPRLLQEGLGRGGRGGCCNCFVVGYFVCVARFRPCQVEMIGGRDSVTGNTQVTRNKSWVLEVVEYYVSVTRSRWHGRVRLR